MCLNLLCNPQHRPSYNKIKRQCVNSDIQKFRMNIRRSQNENGQYDILKGCFPVLSGTTPLNSIIVHTNPSLTIIDQHIFQ